MKLVLTTVIASLVAFGALSVWLGLWSPTGDRDLDMNLALPIQMISAVIAVLCVLVIRKDRKGVVS